MKDGIKYNTGATGLAGSLGTATEAALSKGFTDESPDRPDPLTFFSSLKEDDCGNTNEGDSYEFRKTGVVGRANGTDR